MNQREPNPRGQQRGGSGQDMSRQADQWQAEPPRQAGSLQDDDNRPAYDDYVREGDDRSAGTDERRGGGAHLQHFYDPTYGNDFSSFTSEDYGGRDFYARRGGVAGGMRPSESYRPSYGVTRWFGDDYGHERDYDEWRSYGQRRGFLKRAGDEIASWFGDEDAARRREMDHSGRGPADYIRSDERIREDANDCLTRDPRVDATHISVAVSNCEVTLNGTVHDRRAKRRAEDLVEDISGVKHVQNNLRVADYNMLSADKSASEWTSGEKPH